MWSESWLESPVHLSFFTYTSRGWSADNVSSITVHMTLDSVISWVERVRSLSIWLNFTHDQITVMQPAVCGVAFDELSKIYKVADNFANNVTFYKAYKCYM